MQVNTGQTGKVCHNVTQGGIVDRLVNYVLTHRRGKVFRGMSPEAVREELETLPLVYASDTQGNIVGIVVYEPQPGNTLFIKRLLATSKGAIREFLAKAREMFPGYTMAAMRRDKPVTYTNTPRFMHLLEAMT